MKYIKYGHGEWHKAFELIIDKHGILCYDYKKCLVAGIRSNGNYEVGAFEPSSMKIHWKGLMTFDETH